MARGIKETTYNVTWTEKDEKSTTMVHELHCKPDNQLTNSGKKPTYSAVALRETAFNGFCRDASEHFLRNAYFLEVRVSSIFFGKVEQRFTF